MKRESPQVQCKGLSSGFFASPHFDFFSETFPNGVRYSADTLKASCSRAVVYCLVLTHCTVFIAAAFFLFSFACFHPKRFVACVHAFPLVVGSYVSIFLLGVHLELKLICIYIRSFNLLD